MSHAQFTQRFQVHDIKRLGNVSNFDYLNEMHQLLDKGHVIIT